MKTHVSLIVLGLLISNAGYAQKFEIPSSRSQFKIDSLDYYSGTGHFKGETVSSGFDFGCTDNVGDELSEFLIWHKSSVATTYKFSSHGSCERALELTRHNLSMGKTVVLTIDQDLNIVTISLGKE